MGKEWNWVGGRSSRREVGGGTDGDSAANEPTGCMCAVFQLFDFHQFQFALHQQPHQQQQQQQQQLSFKPNSFIPEEISAPMAKGTEAPRKILDSEEPPPPLPSTIREDENLNIPMGIQIRTSRDRSSTVHGGQNDYSSSDFSSSPGTKTPTLVARLMGLDLLPDQGNSPICSAASALGTPNLVGKSRLQHHLRPRQPALQCKSVAHRSSLDSADPTGTRSLPETPRISSARRSDVDHRLSLQISKENMSPGEELVLSRISHLRRKELKTEEESRSPGHYARQIVKQVKVSVNRKVGLDITNTVRNRDRLQQAAAASREELVSQFKSKKLSKALTKVVVVDDSISSSSPGKISTTSCSPRLKFLEAKTKSPASSSVAPSPTNKDHSNVSYPSKPSLSTSPHVNNNILPQNYTRASSIKPVRSRPLQEQECQHQEDQQQVNQRPLKKCKKVEAEERLGPSTRLKKATQTSDVIRTKQEETFVRPATASRANISTEKKCKKTPLSNHLLKISIPTLLPVKKDPTPLATKIPHHKQASNAQESKRSSQLSSCSSHWYSYKEEQLEATRSSAVREDKNHNNEDTTNGSTASTPIATTEDGSGAEECEYITRILKRTGIDKDTQVSYARWFSPSHPLDPATFYYLEYFTTITPMAAADQRGQLSHRCNRKLLFHLVDEILVDILRPYLNMKPWSRVRSMKRGMQGSQLVDMLCEKVRRFPRADCRVLEDIDALIDVDMPRVDVDRESAFGEEGEGIVVEIEKELLDALVRETAEMIFHGRGGG